MFLITRVFDQKKAHGQTGQQTRLHSTKSTKLHARARTCKRRVILKGAFLDMESMVRNPLISSWVSVLPLPVTLLSHQKKRLTHVPMTVQVSCWTKVWKMDDLCVRTYREPLIFVQFKG